MARHSPIAKLAIAIFNIPKKPRDTGVFAKNRGTRGLEIGVIFRGFFR